MSFAGSINRPRRRDAGARPALASALRSRPPAAAPRGEPLPPPASAPRGRPFSRRPDWGKVALFGGGLALGALLGAGAALLAAPYSGLETRTRLRRSARRMRHGAADRWDDLRDELRDAARDARHRLGQRVRRQMRKDGTDRDD